MVKKRKAGGRPFGQNGSRRETNGDSRLRINTYEDVADSEDEFHINRDKVLLEENLLQKRVRKTQEDKAFFEPSDEEVLPVSHDGSDSDEEYEDASEIRSPPQKRLKLEESGKNLQDSDSQYSAPPPEDEDAGGWGASRKDYYDTDKIETEADALEEELEARRLQQKQLQGMTEADFGIDEMVWRNTSQDGSVEDEDGQGKVISEVLPRLEITDAMGPEERLKILRTRYPEFEPLANEFIELRPLHNDLTKAHATAKALYENELRETGNLAESEDMASSILHMKCCTLGCYLATLCMYFALFTAGQSGSDGQFTPMLPHELHEHTIMNTLVQLRDIWALVQGFSVPIANVTVDECQTTSAPEIEHAKFNNHLEKTVKSNKKPKIRKSKAQRAAEAAQAEWDTKLLERMQKTEENLQGLSTLIQRVEQPLESRKAVLKTQDESDSDIGEQTALTAHEAAEKAKRKKSLRFYTSQIAQKSNKRGAAGRDAGGDADIPYRERLKDRQARLNAEAEKRGKKPKESGIGHTLGGPSEEEDHATAKELRNGQDSGSEDYYDLVASRSANKKAAKAALAAANVQAAQQGGLVRVIEDEGVDGKRAISYAIEKNKGLMPKRKKDVRNPRVKKRKKFEEKKKKLGSVRPVWKGGEGRGGYAGELTGIKKNLVKSIKL